LSTPSAPCWVRHSYLSKVLRYTPYTCGSLDDINNYEQKGMKIEKQNKSNKEQEKKTFEFIISFLDLNTISAKR
jgi:hypothetical protein